MIQNMKTYFTYLLICATISSMVSAITLSNQKGTKSRITKLGSSSTAEPSVTTTASTASKDKGEGLVVYRYLNSNSQTCILLKTDAVVEVKFSQEEVDSFVPKALVDGDCRKEDSSFMRISWKDFNLVLNFAKTGDGEKWYIKTIELSINPDIPEFHGVNHGKPIKLYHRETLIPTPVGKAYSCPEVVIDLVPDKDDHPSPGLKGSLFLRALQVQPFMNKEEDFESLFECDFQKSYTNQTGSLL